MINPIFLYLGLLSGYIFTRGFYSFFGLLILTVVLLILFYFLFKSGHWGEFKLKIKSNDWQIVFLVSIFLSILLYGGLYQTNILFKNISFLFLVFAFVFSLSLIFSKIRQVKSLIKYSFWVLFLLAILARIFMVLSSPNPLIDVFDLLKNGSLALWHGQNPYEQNFAPLYGHSWTYYTYLPFSIIFVLPFTVFFSDPRIGLIFADFATTLILFWLLGKKTNEDKNLPQLIPLIYLYNPMALYILEESYIEPILVFLLTLFLFLLSVKKEGKLAQLVLGTLLAFKQTALVLPFFLLRSGLFKLKDFLLPLVFSAVLILPFFFWNIKEFINDTLIVYVTFPPRHDGLTLNSLFFRVFGFDVPFFVFPIFWALAFLIIFKFPKKGISGFLFSISLFLLTFFLFNKYAFVEFYFLVSSLFLFSLVL